MHDARVLLVEDDRTISEALFEALGDEGANVFRAFDGHAAERFLADPEGWDCVLLDLMLPGPSGLELLRGLRTRDTETPVLILTARGEESDKVLGLELGADDYVTKPFGVAELMARIDAVLRRLARDGGFVWYGVFTESAAPADDGRHQREKLAAIGRLAGGVAHDFNNTLAAILSHVRLLQMELPRWSEAARRAQEIDACARRAADLTKQLMVIAREREAEETVVELNRVAGEIVEMYRRIIAPDIALVVALRDGPDLVRIDPTQLKQVVMNLIVNARDAMRELGGRLEIATERRALVDDDGGRDSLSAGEYVALRVSDTGCGIDEAAREHIFEPLFTTKPEGAGLGLATCHEIVRGASGSIEVTSTPGGGTTFTVLLPIVPEIA